MNSSTVHACYVPYPSLRPFCHIIILGEEYKLRGSSLHYFLSKLFSNVPVMRLVKIRAHTKHQVKVVVLHSSSFTFSDTVRLIRFKYGIEKPNNMADIRANTTALQRILQLHLSFQKW
jgi:hypothetical protein